MLKTVETSPLKQSVVMSYEIIINTVTVLINKENTRVKLYIPIYILVAQNFEFS